MTPQPDGGLDQATLLQQVSWIRRLAHELVADRDLAEDLVQETCVVALQRAPREAGKLRQWLAEVLRNALRQHARGQGRRTAREQVVARAEALEPADRLVERVLLQRELVNAVLELEEPYRSTVLLRFFEELPPREIARRTGTPLATVNSRLQRALARLRERLDGHHQAWATLFLPWVKGLDVVASRTLLSVLMKTKLTLAAGAAALAATAFVLWNATPEDERGDDPRAPAVGLSEPIVPGPGSPQPADEPAGNERESLTAPARAPRERAAAESTPAADKLAWTVRLRVFDAEGLPMSGIDVCAEEGGDVLGRSGAGGWCVFDTHADSLVLRAADPRWVTIHEGSRARASSLDPVLVLAPAIALEGTVVDVDGRPLVGAGVRFNLPEGFHTRFSEVLEASRSLSWRTVSDASGHFAFEQVPALEESRLRAVAAGYEHGELAAPLVSARDLELVLRRPAVPLSGALSGVVLDTNGVPIEGARVGLGLTSVVSDERGHFDLSLARAVTADVMNAVKAGYLPARLERPGEPGPGRSGWPDEVVLILPGPALSIRGVVLDDEGKPVSGARVWVHDPTPSAPIGLVPGFLEPLMAGASVPNSALESEAHLPAEDGDSFMDWHTQAREPSLLWNWVVSDGAGGFELGGLDQRRYKLDVLRPGSLEVVTSESIAAGERSAVVRLGPPDVFEHVRGVVRGEDGAALPDVEVELFRPMIDARARVFGGNSQVLVVEPAGTVTTDAEGRFEFASVPRNGAELSIRGDSIVPTSVAVDRESLELTVEVRCHLEVVVTLAGGRFDAIAVADGDGRPLDILELSEGSMNAWTSVNLVDGRSGVVSVSSRARELRLLKDGVLIETHALDLVPGDVNRIDL